MNPHECPCCGHPVDGWALNVRLKEENEELRRLLERAMRAEDPDEWLSDAHKVIGSGRRGA
jgi:hypothetical protein